MRKTDERLPGGKTRVQASFLGYRDGYYQFEDYADGKKFRLDAIQCKNAWRLAPNYGYILTKNKRKEIEIEFIV